MTKLFLNHRLRLAADLDLFEDLLEHLEEENRIIEEKSDRMSQLSMSISRTSQNIQRKSISASFASKENFDGFAVSKLQANEISTTNSTSNNSKLIPSQKLVPNFGG